MSNKQLLFSLSKKDFIIETFCVGGHGGQNMQKNATGVRIKHPDSGAVSACRDERSQLQNKKKAFNRLVQTSEFKKWHRIQTAKALGNYIDIEKYVDDAMQDKNLKFEIRIDGKWVQVSPTDINDLEYDDLE
jgi:hypothetical protein